MKNLTALISCFARAYHAAHSQDPVYADPAAALLLTEQEKESVARSIIQGRAFFCPGFEGTDEEALALAVDRQLAPSVLGRSAFCKRCLDRAVRFGYRQYLIHAAGYDGSAYGALPGDMRVFELDRPAMSRDKQARVAAAGLEREEVAYIACDYTDENWQAPLLASGYDPAKTSFHSLLGISYYLTPAEWEGFIAGLSGLSALHSELVLDYQTGAGAAAPKHERLAAAAGAPIRARYDYREMEALLARHGWLIYEHLDAEAMQAQFFGESGLSAPADVACLLAVKKE